MGRRGRLDYVDSAPMLPAFKPLPKVHDCTLLLPRKGRAPFLVECVAEIAVVHQFSNYQLLRTVASMRNSWNNEDK
jgi:hypothetical protein